MKKHKALLVAIAGYIMLVGFVFGGALMPREGMMLFGDDIHRQYYFYREFFNTWMSQGVFPWWNPYLFGGEPFIANPVVNIWYPPNWLFFFLPLNIAYLWHVAFHLFWAMLGMYCALRAMANGKWQMANSSSWVGGVIFGLSGFFMARTFAGHVDVIAAASFMPWVLWAFWRLLVDTEVANKNLDTSPVSLVESKHSSLKARSHSQSGAVQNFIGSPHRLIIASAIFAFQLLAGYQTMAFFTMIAVGIMTVLYAIQTRSLMPLCKAGIAGIVGVALAAIQILPAAEFFGRSIRTFQFPYSWHSYGSLEWRSLLQFLNPFFFGNQYTYNGPPPNFIEHSAFVGVGGIALSVLGVLFLVCKSFKCFTLSTSLREEKYIAIVGWSFVGFIVFGLWISLGPNAPIDLQYILWQFVPMYHYLRIPPRHLILVVFGLAGLSGIGFNMLPKSLRVVRFLLSGVIVVEMVLFARSFIEVKPVPEFRHDKELISLLKQDKNPYRVLQNFGVWVEPRDVMDFDSVMSYGIFSATGYDPSILRSYYAFIARSSGKSGEDAVLDVDVQVPYVTPRSAETIDHLNIKYILVPREADPFYNTVRYTLVREKPTYLLYENTTVKDRFYFQKGCGTAEVEKYSPNIIVIQTKSTCDDTLLSSEVWYPGWKATIDGKETTIGKLNDTFRTLFVPSGTHTIVYAYKPIIYIWSALISSIAILSLIVFSFRRR